MDLGAVWGAGTFWKLQNKASVHPPLHALRCDNLTWHRWFGLQGRSKQGVQAVAWGTAGASRVAQFG